MFDKILIANRGEIAVRVIKTCQKLGIKTVAVYSEADVDSLHVLMADEAIAIGPAAASESYLVIDKIIAACKETGAQAVHPGFGFLSEKADFCEALKKEGITFIGPDVLAIDAMGDKIRSKKLASDANVSTVPGHIGEIESAEEAVKIASDIGYPVMIKASAGGGGKGMRLAWNDEEAAEGFQSAVNEGKSAFGDGRVFIEKFIEDPRHIEIQVLGDKHGNVIHLLERECSIQRRHQKVIEEAPSPFLDDATRAAMGAEAVALAKAVDYCSAGTVEFIVDKNRNFYFLEMNTRLQVEHPVTEYITGIDLVEQMIRVAAGEKLSLQQDDIKPNGWALESRVYAEDPYRGFLPSIGRLGTYKAPAEGDGVRVDSGVYEGAEISMFYDPMIAKLVTWGKDREEARLKMRNALDSYYIRGIGHNIDFLSAVMVHPRFAEGRLSTNFIAEEYPDGFSGGPLSEQGKEVLGATAAMLYAREQARAWKIDGRGADYSLPVQWVVDIDGDQHPAEITLVDGGADVLIEGSMREVRSDWQPGQPLFVGSVNGRDSVVQIDRLDQGYRLTHDGAAVSIRIRSPREAELSGLMPVKVAPDTSKYLLCPMPGLVLRVDVAEGDEVKAGQALAVVEAMKMENVLKAEKDAIVKKVSAQAGDSLAVDDVIIEFE